MAPLCMIVLSRVMLISRSCNLSGHGYKLKNKPGKKIARDNLNDLIIFLKVNSQ